MTSATHLKPDSTIESATATYRLRTFVSYSRKDSVFVQALSEALIARNFLVDFDRSTYLAETASVGISASDDWWVRLQDMIASADAMILVVSPDSAASKVVDEEIAYARFLSKRVIAITCREIDFTAAPPRLAALNVNHWFVQNNFDAAIDALCIALDRDTDWLRASSRHAIDAKSWSDAGKIHDKLLFGADIADAEAWSARRPNSAPPVPDLVLEYIVESRKAQTRREKSQQAVRNVIAALVAIAFVVTACGAWFVIDGQRALSVSKSQMLATSAETLVRKGDWLRGFRVASLGTRESFLSPSSESARLQLASIAQSLALQADIRAHASATSGAALSPRADRVLTWIGAEDDAEHYAAILWDAKSGLEIPSPLRHDKTVLGGAFSSDGSSVLTWGWDHTARLWDASTGRSRGAPLLHPSAVTGAAFSKDGSVVLTWSGDYYTGVENGQARLWDAATLQPVTPWLEHSAIVAGAAFSHDERRIITWSKRDFASGAEQARVWDAATGAQIGPVISHSGITGATMDEAGLRVITWGDDRAVRVWDAASGVQLPFLLDFELPVGGVAVSNDQTRMLVWSGPTVQLLELATGQKTQLSHDNIVLGASFSRDARRVLSWSSDNTARIWDVVSSEQIGPSLSHSGDVQGAMFSSSEALILTWSVDGTAKVWLAATGQQIGPSLNHDASLSYASFASDDLTVATSDALGTTRLWKTPSYKQVLPALLDGERIGGPDTSADISALTIWSPERVKLWDAQTGAVKILPDANVGTIQGVALANDGMHVAVWSNASAAVLDARGNSSVIKKFEHSGNIERASLSFDGSTLLAWGANKAGDGSTTASLWNVETGKRIGAILKFAEEIDGVKFSSDGRAIVVWDSDGRARIIDCENGLLVGAVTGFVEYIEGASFSRDRSRVLSWANMMTLERGAIRQTNAATGDLVGPAFSYKKEILGATYSPDESQILIWMNDWFSDDAGELQVIDARTGDLVGGILRHNGLIAGARFSADGSRVLSWSDDATARLWDVSSGAQIGMSFWNDGPVQHAGFANDELRIFTWRDGVSPREWDQSLGGLAASPSRIVTAVCTAKLNGADQPVLRRQKDDNDQDKIVPVLDALGQPLRQSSRRLDALDIDAAPLLQGRHGEDVCTQWSPPWYDDLLKVTLGWAFPNRS